MQHLGKITIVAGVVLVIIGLLLTFSDKIPLLGKLPGDFRIERENFSFYFPLTTSILLSLLLTLLFYLFRK